MAKFPEPHQPVGEYLSPPLGGDSEDQERMRLQRKGYSFRAVGNPNIARMLLTRDLMLKRLAVTVSKI